MNAPLLEVGADENTEAAAQDPQAAIRALYEDLERRVAERTAEIEARTRQQAAVADLGHRALRGRALGRLLKEAAEVVAGTLGAEHSYILKLLPGEKELLLLTGVGWKRGMVGRATVAADRSTQAGYALDTRSPVVVEDFRFENRFTRSPLLLEHHVVSGLSVVIATDKPYGVLGVHSNTFRAFTEDDVHFLQSVANVLATAIEREQSERAARMRTATLLRTINALRETPELDAFLGRVLASLSEFLGAPSATLWFYERAEYSLSLHMVYHEGEIIPGTELRRPVQSLFVLPERIAFWQQMVKTQRPLVVDVESKAAGDPYFEWLRSRGYRYALIVPMLVGDEPIGWFGFRSVEQHSYRQDEIEFAQALAQQATLAVRLTRFAEKEQRSAILQERTRLAQEIHDTIAQGLTGILVQMSAADSAPVDNPEATRAHVARAREIARDCLAEARRSVQALRPAALEGGTLAEAFARLAERMAAGTSIQTAFQVHGATRILPPETEANLLRIGTEALTNALRHAEANHISITLTFESNQTRLAVQDNGKGIDNEHKPGYGIIGMRERAESLGGILTILRGAEDGTEVVVTVPAVDPLATLKR